MKETLERIVENELQKALLSIPESQRTKALPSVIKEILQNLEHDILQKQLLVDQLSIMAEYLKGKLQ